ncbi:MAG: diacylglycerol kinase family lipid kinase [Candidatus Aminicenantes bacterium]|nr:diacylglycerol kinase family lipid kinase [Candidatus Aminicenantes bacterium]
MDPDCKTLLVLNPHAGKGKGLKIFKQVGELLGQSLKNMETRISEYAGHAFQIGREAANQGYGRILTVGGDGTPFEVINGFYADGRPRQPLELGMIPAGTGNSFLRDFGELSWRRAAENVLSGRSRHVDLVEISYQRDGRQVRQYYLNILGVGLIADILKLTNEKLKRFGSMGYSLAVMLRLAKGMRNRMQISVDGINMEITNSALVISNSKYTGGSMKIAPMAHTADGQVDMVIFQSVNRRDILNIFSKVFKGTHVGHDRVKTYRASEIVIDSCPQELLMADGELLGLTPLSLKVLPKELVVLA